MSKRAQVGKLQALGFGVVIFGASLGIGAYILAQIGTKVTGSAAQVTGNATEALVTMAAWLGILAIAAVGGLAVYFVLSYMSGRGR